MKATTRKIETDVHNRQRRKVLQGLLVSTGAMLAPGIGLAACGDHTDTTASYEFDSDSIVVEFSDPASNEVDGVLARVSIHNNSEKEIRLSHLSTGNVTTRHGVYDINSRLHRSPVAVGPNGVYHFWLRPNNATALPANTLPAPALTKTARTTTLQLRIVRGDNHTASARQNRLIRANIA